MNINNIHTDVRHIPVSFILHNINPKKMQNKDLEIHEEGNLSLTNNDEMNKAEKHLSKAISNKDHDTKQIKNENLVNAYLDQNLDVTERNEEISGERRVKKDLLSEEECEKKEDNFGNLF
jgi:hypothetical protein